MIFEDAGNILNGGDTAATDYFRDKTAARIYDKFETVIASSMNNVGVTRLHNNMMTAYNAIPLAQMKISFDLDKHVTTKALDGLFYTVGEEEKKIRKDPAARVSDLLKTVFAEKK